jgi:pimeloyl-ACP methyl ester carboxylesterase
MRSDVLFIWFFLYFFPRLSPNTRAASKEQILTQNILNMSFVNQSRIFVDGVNIFYRHAGSPTNPTILLLHGYPSSSHQYRNLIPLLSKKYYVISPDYPGFGFTEVPTSRNYTYTFANLTTTVEQFLDALKIQRFIMYIFDFGAPVGLRLALRRPGAISAIITQNGNAYEEGLGKPWIPVRDFWATNSEEGKDSIRARVRDFERVKGQYLAGSQNEGVDIQPEGYHLDYALLQRPGIIEAMVDLFYDYGTNVEHYPKFQQYLRERKPPVLAIWGKNDISFIPPGAEAFRRDVPGAEVHLIEGGHFALEGRDAEFAEWITDFLSRNGL